MWKNLAMPPDIQWLRDAVTNNTLICVTDGSYNLKAAPTICTAGWIIFCRATGRFISSSLIERSDSASSYRGELLGMLAIYLILYAIEEYYEVNGGTDILCDNKGALYTFQKKSKRIPAGAKNNDIQRVLRQTKSKMKSTHLLHHVKAHQDDTKKIEDLPLEAQLNCYCNEKAKADGVDGIMNGVETRQTLPMESACVFIGKNKQTTDLEMGLRYHIGKARARTFYIERDIMDAPTFDSVTWEDLRDTLALKPKMYQLWFSKQGSDHCGTRVMLKRWDKTANSKCPNCGIANESAAHLNRCTNRDRKMMLLKCINKLKEWMIENHTYPELIEWVPQYLGREKIGLSTSAPCHET